MKTVEPHQYEGRLLHQLPALRTRIGDIYAEPYLSEPSDSNRDGGSSHARLMPSLTPYFD
jgi:hypothetical protein